MIDAIFHNNRRSDNRRSDSRLVGIVYARTSADEDRAFSVESQVKAGLEYAARNNIYVPDAYIFREDYTGTVMDRPELNKIRKLMRDRKFDIFIGYDTTRLARKIGVADYLLDEIFSSEIQLHLVSWRGQVYDTPEDRNRFNNESVYADTERRKIKERTTRGMKEKIEQGIWSGRGKIDRYGYTKVGTKRNTRLEIVEEERAVIVQIFDLFVNRGYRGSEIIQYLNAHNIPSPAQSKGMLWHLKRQLWEKSSVYRILRDECYIGKFYSGKKVLRNGKYVRPGKEEWILMEYPELRMVDDTTFYKAQEMLDTGRARYAPTGENDVLLQRRCKCACGYASHIQVTHQKSGRVDLYYKCGGKGERAIPKEACSVPYLRIDETDPKIWSAIEELLKNPKVRLKGLTRARDLQREDQADAIENMESIQDRVERYNQELDDIYQDYRDRLITRDIYVKRKEVLDRRLADAAAIYQEYEERVNEHVLSDGEISRTAEELSKLNTVLERLGVLSFEHKRRVVELMNITGRLHIEDDGLWIRLYIYTYAFDDVMLEEFGTSCYYQLHTHNVQPLVMRILLCPFPQ